MKRKEQYADEIIEMLEHTKGGAWASNINLNTKDRVIEVCQNVVDSWSGRKFKDHCTTSPQALEQTRWIPVSERLPEKDGRFLTYIENPYDIQLSYVMVCDYIRQTWCPDDETASSNVVAWMPLPELYKTESEVQDADSDGDRR